MLELFRKDMQLYVKVLMNLRIPIKYQNKVFGKGEKNELLLPDEVNDILTKNGNIKLWTGKDYVKLNLGQFYEVMQRKQYKIVELIEPKVEVKQPEVKVEKKEEPKVEVKVEKKEEPKVEVKQPEVKVEEPKVEVKQPEVKVEKKEEPKVEEVKKEEPKQNENKNQQPKNNNNNNKPRHNNNNNKQGGGK
jgi:hypothetical protein